MEKHLPIIVVTGFGPFGNHKINASWEAVKCLSTLQIEEEFKVRLITIEIPVEYEFVERMVPKLWEDYKPLMMVHVGVSSFASELTLEMEAHRSGYCQLDTQGRVPQKGCCCLPGDECLRSTLDIPSISLTAVSQEVGTHVPACVVSSNAGRYLCEFTYYTSLSIDKSRSLFIHVPELGKPYTAEQLAIGIKGVLREMMNKLTHRESNH